MRHFLTSFLLAAVAAACAAQPTMWGGAKVRVEQGDTAHVVKASAFRSYITSTGTWTGAAIGAQYGGTGQTSYTTGDILQATASTTLSKLAAVATGNALISGGVGTASSWGKIGLSTHVSGTLPVASGGTGTGSTLTGLLLGSASAFTAITSTTAGQIPRCTGSNTFAFGALDLADADAVTGVLPFANGGTSTASGRATGQTAANTNVVTYTVGGSDESLMVSANVLVTASSGENFNIKVDYTDEGNTARTFNLNVTEPSGSTTANIRFATGAVPYSSFMQHIRCKSGTDVKIYTTGTFTGCTYNVEGHITRI